MCQNNHLAGPYLRKLEVPEGLTDYRAETWRMIACSGATPESPAHFSGARFRAALWLYEQGLCELVGRGFCPSLLL